MKKIYLLFTALWMYGGLFAQQPSIRAIEEGAGRDFVQSSLVEYSSGVYIIAGTLVDSNNNSDILVVKIDNAGTLYWSKEIQYANDSFVGSLIVDDAGHIVLTGYEGLNGVHAQKNLIVVKLNEDGDLVGDVVIEDTETNYTALYGLDLVEAAGYEDAKRGYIIVGIGTHDDIPDSPKYGLVFYIDHTLSSILWEYGYQSHGTSRNNDSFNHILEVRPNGPYLLTGSGTTPGGAMMVTNDLIDVSGTSLWGGGAVGHSWSVQDYINPGVMALYKQSTDEFWVVSYGMANSPVLLRLDGSTGNGYEPWYLHNNFWGLPPDNINLINGMKWRDNNQDRILLSGYHIDPTMPLGAAWPMLIDVDLGGSPSLWMMYNSSFNGADLQTINFDSIVKPLNHTHSTNNYMHNQLYYQPKSMVHDSFNPNSGPQFVEPYQDNGGGNPFGVSFVNTINHGQINSCVGVISTNHGLPPTIPLTTYFNYRNSFIPIFTIKDTQANISSADVGNSLICQSPPSKPFMGINGRKGSLMKVYPNPASDNLFISGELKKEVKIVMYDLRGRKIPFYSYEEKIDKISLDISGLQEGIYFLEVRNPDGVVLFEKIIKQ